MQPFLLLLAFLLPPGAVAGEVLGSRVSQCDMPFNFFTAGTKSFDCGFKKDETVDNFNLMSINYDVACWSCEEIIRGHEAKPHSRPYMVYFQFWREDIWRKCGGVLVQKDFVLTAAHCQGSSMNVILGAHDIKQPERTQQLIPVKKAIPHPDYDNTTKLNNIMLLQLQTKARLTAAVSTLSLPVGNSHVSPGQLCSVAGWGRISVNISTSKLHEVELTIQEDQVCECIYSKYYKGSELCVGDPKKKMASFKGDSGGPLVCNSEVHGIVSYGDKNGTPPRIFTKISSFLPWIKETMKRLQLKESY